MRPRLPRPLLIGLALAALVALAWAGWRIGHPAGEADVTARPALWRITDGDREAWLFGTIHAVPRGERWLSPAIVRAAGRSDRLVLEVTGLAAERRSRAIFERLGRSPGLPPLAERLDPADAAALRALERHAPAAMAGLAAYESWAAALLLNAAAASRLALSSEEAAEAVLTRRFEAAGKPVEGLETIEGQLGLFDGLDEADQRALLAQAVREAGDAARLYAELHAAWAAGDTARLERQFLAPLARAPALRRVLVDERNRQWAAHIDADLRGRPGRVLIAVGAGHLLGPDGVQARLARLGWRVERVQ